MLVSEQLAVLKELVVKDSFAQQPDREAVDDPRKAKQKPKPIGPPAIVAKVIAGIQAL